jgi:hypothetical protein
LSVLPLWPAHSSLSTAPAEVLEQWPSQDLLTSDFRPTEEGLDGGVFPDDFALTALRGQQRRQLWSTHMRRLRNDISNSTGVSVEVRRIEIQNFRGIKSLDFRVPPGKAFVCLIGPGDSAKSTILDAVHFTLGERWSLSLSDTDFFGGDVSEPLTIRVALGDLPSAIRGHDVLGLRLAGIDVEGEWRHDPTNDVEPCVIVQLRVDDTLEPTWTVYRPGDDDETPVRAGVRRKFSVFKIDDRVDNHLRWTSTSALTRLTDSSHGAAGTLAAALLAARAAAGQAITPALQVLTDAIAARLSELGSGAFPRLKPGLDTSRSSSAGTLALFDGAIPLTSFGLGTRRLAGIATQEMAAENKSIILVDEIEHGLEPHRLVHLLKHLHSDLPQTQVFATTHSAVAVEQLNSTDLAVVRCVDGDITCRFVPEDMQFAQATLRGGPSSFLARRVVVTEGKTEFGLLLGFVDYWDRQAAVAATPTSASSGVAITDGGGSNAPNRAAVLAELGYETALFMDNDDRGVDDAVRVAAEKGVQICRWRLGFATEDELVTGLDPAGLTLLLAVAVEVRVDGHTVRSDLLNCRLTSEPEPSDLNVDTWLTADGFTLEQARSLIIRASRKCRWFKNVAAGRSLSNFVISHGTALRAEPFGNNLASIKSFIYPPTPSPSGATRAEAEAGS